MLDRICSWLDVHRSGDADESDGEDDSSTANEDAGPWGEIDSAGRPGTGSFRGGVMTGVSPAEG